MRRLTHYNGHWLLKFTGPKDILCDSQRLPMLPGQIKELNKCWGGKKDGKVKRFCLLCFILFLFAVCLSCFFFLKFFFGGAAGVG